MHFASSALYFFNAAANEVLIVSQYLFCRLRQGAKQGQGSCYLLCIMRIFAEGNIDFVFIEPQLRQAFALTRRQAEFMQGIGCLYKAYMIFRVNTEQHLVTQHLVLAGIAFHGGDGFNQDLAGLGDEDTL